MDLTYKHVNTNIRCERDATGQGCEPLVGLRIVLQLLCVQEIQMLVTRHNYILSVGLDASVAFMAILICFTLHIKDIYRPTWWGLGFDYHRPFTTCPTAPGIMVPKCPVF